MELVEVVLQGVRGAPTLTRWTFPPGVAVVPAGPAELLAVRSAYELLTGDQDGVVGAAMLPESGAQARVAIIVVGRDQRRYRLLWELQSGRRALQVMNGDKLEVVSTSQAEILQTITAQVGFPQSDALREIFFSFSEDLPSKRLANTSEKPGTANKADKPLPPGFGDGESKQADASKPLPPGFGGGATTSRFAGRPEGELRARLAEIASRSEGKVDVQALEFEIDGLQKKVFELQARRRPLTDLESNLATLDGQLVRFAHFDALPEDFLERAQRLETIKVEHARELERLDLESENLIQSVGHLSEEVSGVRQRGGARPMQAAAQDPLVKWGLVGGVSAIAVGVLGGLASESLRWVALLDIPAFGVAVFGGIKLLSGLEEGASTRMKLTRIASERNRALERFSIDKEQIARLLEKNQLVFEQLPELTQGYAVRYDLLARRALLVAERADLISQGVNIGQLDEEAAKTAERLKTLEDQLQVAGDGYDPEVAELAREADEIERVLRGELGPEVAEAEAAPTPTAPPPDAAAPIGVDVAFRLVRLASDLLVQSVDDAVTALAPRAGQMAQAFTEGRYTGISGAPKGLNVLDKNGAAIAFGQLPGADRDLVAFALKLAIVESVTKSMGRVPVLIDRVFDLFPVEQAPLFARAMQFLGQSTQVICFTQRRELAGAGTIVQAQVAPAATPSPPAAS